MPKRNPYYEGEKSDHFDGLRFHSPNEPPDRTHAERLRLLFCQARQRWPSSYPVSGQDKPPERVNELRIVSAGHASILLQLSGLNLLVDPVWSERVSPFSLAGPRRLNAPGVLFDDLPPIDVVLITHNHYDHLDVRTVARLWGRFRPRIVAPLGNGSIIHRSDPTIEVETHDWGDRVALSDRLILHLEPAFHWSGRGLRDRRMTLWTSYVLTSTAGGVLYHVGDTGYGDGSIFRAINSKFGPPDVALLPIGAYEPRWYMQTQHVNPEEAVRIMLDTGAAQAFGHHWGTFRLTQEPVEAPVADLAMALGRHGIPPERFQSLRPGQPVQLNWR